MHALLKQPDPDPNGTAFYNNQLQRILESLDAPHLLTAFVDGGLTEINPLESNGDGLWGKPEAYPDEPKIKRQQKKQAEKALSLLRDYLKNEENRNTLARMRPAILRLARSENVGDDVIVMIQTEGDAPDYILSTSFSISPS